MARADRLLLANAILGQFLSGFATRIFIVSLPTIAGALDADILAISWAVIAYQLAGISLSVVFGRLGDVRGRYAIYGLGFAVMAVSSLLCGLATSAIMLVLFRLVQGVGAAMLASAARVLAMEAMPEGSAGRANGFMTMAFHAGFLIGPPVGGLVIDLVSWRWIFFLLVPVSATGVILTAMRARGQQARPGGTPAPVDYAGAGLLVVLTVLLAVLFDRRTAETMGTSEKGVMTFVLVATLIGFIARERRALDPVVNFALFRIRMFTVSVLSLLLTATANSALAFLMPFYLQDVLHLSPSFIGLIFLAAPVFTIACAAVTGPLTDWIGPRVPTAIGILMTMAAFLAGWLLRVDSHWMLPAVVMGLVGVGTGFFNTPNQTAILGSVPREYRGFAAGMVQTVFGMSSLVGISLTGVLLTVLFRHYAGQPDRRPGPEDPVAFVASMNGIYLACAGLMVVALAASSLRGARIESAADVGRG